MQEGKCLHQWEMTNVQPGFIITEKCAHCKIISTYFSNEQRPPLEEYREGDHFWNVMESAQSIRFDLKCHNCDLLVEYTELCGIMLCTGCSEECKLGKIMKQLENERTWLYVAFGFLPVYKKKKLSDKKILYLEDYFNQRRKSTVSHVKFVSHELIDDIADCYGEVIKDIGMLELAAPDQ
ncbi:MAG: hypothetical protein NTW49_09590 [Bacteroidia bacterium]|nr:hypothetical protein [Bacteroidia bacterium]